MHSHSRFKKRLIISGCPVLHYHNIPEEMMVSHCCLDLGYKGLFGVNMRYLFVMVRGGLHYNNTAAMTVLKKTEVQVCMCSQLLVWVNLVSWLWLHWCFPRAMLIGATAELWRGGLSSDWLTLWKINKWLISWWFGHDTSLDHGPVKPPLVFFTVTENFTGRPLVSSLLRSTWVHYYFFSCKMITADCTWTDDDK